MNTRLVGSFVFVLALMPGAPPCFAQFTVQANVGASYIEHFSTAITFRMGAHHSVTALYGSNFFINTHDFSNAFLQYDYSVPKWTVLGATPKLGVKGGNSYYTNKYYRWKVVSLIPFAGARYPINEKFEFQFEAGPVWSFEQYLQRRNFGEIGHYRYVLLELKVALAYNLFTIRKQ